MQIPVSRRKVLQAVSAAALAAPSATTTSSIPGPRAEAADTPKICLEAGGNPLSAGSPDPAGMRRVKQLGVDHVLTVGPRMRSEERRVGKECALLCRSRWSPYH